MHFTLVWCIDETTRSTFLPGVGTSESSAAYVLVGHSSRAEMWNWRWSLDVGGHRGLGVKLCWMQTLR